MGTRCDRSNRGDAHNLSPYTSANILSALSPRTDDDWAVGAPRRLGSVRRCRPWYGMSDFANLLELHHSTAWSRKRICGYVAKIEKRPARNTITAPR